VPGRVVLVSPGQWHDFVTHRKSTVYSEVTFSFESATRQVLTVGFEKLLELYTGVPVRLSPVHTSTPEAGQELNAMILRLTDQANSDHRIVDYCIQQNLARILDWIVWTCTSFNKATQKTDSRLVKVKCFLESNYAQSLTVEQIADIAGLSKGYLFRAFRKAYGLPPLAYHKQLRIEAAKTLLRSTALRCYEVGLRCGYDNVPLFHRMFKAATGMTPGQFRRQSQGDFES
jgi:AraC-like DNA-binding protein